MHICTHAHSHMHVRAHTRAHTHILAHIRTRTHAHVHTRTFAHTDAHRHAHIYTPHVHIHTHLHTQTHASTHICTCMWTPAHTHICTHTGTFTHRRTLAHTPLSLWSTRPMPCPSHPVQLICAQRPCSHAPLGSLGRWGAQEGTFLRLRPPPCWLRPGSLGGRGRGVGAPFFGTGMRPRSALRSGSPSTAQSATHAAHFERRGVGSPLQTTPALPVLTGPWEVTSADSWLTQPGGAGTWVPLPGPRPSTAVAVLGPGHPLYVPCRPPALGLHCPLWATEPAGPSSPEPFGKCPLLTLVCCLAGFALRSPQTLSTPPASMTGSPHPLTCSPVTPANAPP